VAVICDQIILSSLRHPSLNIAFILNCWAHFVAKLKDIDAATRLKLLECKERGCLWFRFVDTWAKAATSLHFIVDVFSTFASTM